MESGVGRVVPMRLFANWETDRASTSAVQRTFTMALSRMTFNSVDEQQYSFVVTVKLMGNKRTLRSNDIQVNTNGGRVDLPLNISFIIQYPHFLKRKVNILQILLQRRKRYKNRQMPGYKTLAIGSVNLSEVLQNGNLKEISLFDPESEKEERPSNAPTGRIFVSSCQSLALEVETEVGLQRLKEKEVESEEEEGSSSEAQYSENDQDNAFGSGRKQRMKIRNNGDHKWAQRKNLKQKFVSLLKKFKVSEEDVVGSTSRVENGSSTAKQLEELFEELEDLSDSGPEMVGDNLSIISNPRPGLTPYFQTASRELLPVIKDKRSEESDEDWSSELENAVSSTNSEKCTSNPATSALKVHTSRGDNFLAVENSASRAVDGSEFAHTGNELKGGNLLATTSSALPGVPSPINNRFKDISQTSSLFVRNDGTPTGATNAVLFCGPGTSESNIGEMPSDGKLYHSKFKGQTMEEISSKATSFSDRLSVTFRDVEPWSLNDRLCICSLASLPVLSNLEKLFKLIDCNTFKECRLLISTIVAKIQKFCNNSSDSPPSTTLFVVGHEKLINNVLRAYVESLQTKSAEWINFLRFCVVPPPKSSLGKLIALFDGKQGSLKELFERPSNELSLNDLKKIEDKLIYFASGNVEKLPIGEAMLQLYKKSSGDDNESQIFVPFLAEIKVGQHEDDPDLFTNARWQEEIQVSVTTSSIFPMHGSPPSSPHGSQKISDLQELQIDFWMPSSATGDVGTCGSPSGNVSILSMNSGPKRDTQLLKNSMRANFRSFSILRKHSSDAFSLNFIKEKKKEKMFQKLGMKKGQKNDVESPVVTNCVNNVTRLICRGLGKHPLSVCIDGNLWAGVRFFQASMHWQTHVKYFPICLPSGDYGRRS